MKKLIKSMIVLFVTIVCTTQLAACGGGGGAKIRSLQEYKTVVDNYVSEAVDFGTAGTSQIETISFKATKLSEFNFKFEMETYVGGELEISSIISVDGNKSLYLHTYHTGSFEYTTHTYYDGTTVYEKRVQADGTIMNDWQLEEDAYHTAALFIMAYQQILNPELYEKIEETEQHKYTLKEGVVLPNTSENDTVEIIITKKYLFLEHVSYEGEEIANLSTCKITVGGQSVKKPSDFNL